ncbi:MAG: 23S rRNA (pseudouridine(1915)-N(3))-methyltransferase RlmH [Muribaculaceae bacterium]|nr:23S rRNA (pseudouridine(1915)-N(3))-methyltransferase RlmH [Muribaculaceae bacterium]
MKITLLVVGKTATGYIAQGIEEYASRVRRYVPMDIRVIPDVKRNQGPERQKVLEGEAMLATITGADYVTLLDERGREMTSREFAMDIDRKMVTLPSRWIIVVGGPYGFSQAMYDRANSLLSLSKMTFPHEMVRLFIAEQLYRAMTILRGEPYHHD